MNRPLTLALCAFLLSCQASPPASPPPITFCGKAVPPATTEVTCHDESVSDVSPLASLTNLTYLDLRGTGVIDVSPLASLTNLTYLDLRVSEERMIGSLTDANFQNTQVSAAQVKALQAKLPKCKIITN